MLEMAQEMFKAIQDRFRTTLRVMADLAESVGVPLTVTSLLTGREQPGYGGEECWTAPGQRAATPDQALVVSEAEEPGADGDGKQTRPSRRAAGDQLRAGGDQPRGLRVDDAIGDSTYLARIIWSLGVAELEGTGPLRPADMARMIMSRSAVSLEPPNVARYIRRSKPTCIEVARTEGSSSFYQLNAEGRAIFQELFRNKK